MLPTYLIRTMNPLHKYTVSNMPITNPNYLKITNIDNPGTGQQNIAAPIQETQTNKPHKTRTHRLKVEDP